jgi:hypothetical protein
MPRPTRANPRPDLPIPLSFACDVRWEDMLGAGNRRLCTRCNTAVVDVSALSEAEARRVMAKSGVCVNYRVREGQVVYGEPRTRRLAGRLRRLRRLATAAVAGLVPSVAHAGASPPRTPWTACGAGSAT